MPNELNDRAADDWRPLLAVADIAGGEWPERARAAAIALKRNNSDDQSSGVMLLDDIRAILEETGVEKLATSTILEQLHAMEHRPWPEYHPGKPITDRQIAKLLGPFGISPSTIRLDDKSTPKGYRKSAFQDAFDRYLTAPSATPPQPPETLAFDASAATTQSSVVADGNSRKSREIEACGGVAVKSIQAPETTIWRAPLPRA